MAKRTKEAGESDPRFVFVPSTRSQAYLSSEKMARQVAQVNPLFFVNGLCLSHGRESVRPLFFDKKDMMTAWVKARRANPQMEAMPNYSVLEMTNVLDVLERNPSEYRDFGFVPWSESLDYVKKIRSGGTKVHLHHKAS